MQRKQSLSHSISRRGEQGRAAAGTASMQRCRRRRCVRHTHRLLHAAPTDDELTNLSLAAATGARILLLAVDNHASKLAHRMAAALMRPHDELQVDGLLSRRLSSSVALASSDTPVQTHSQQTYPKRPHTPRSSPSSRTRTAAPMGRPSCAPLPSSRCRRARCRRRWSWSRGTAG
jgi:hypothetical protein